MANQTVNLPAPAANGAGNWVDVSSFGGLKTISVEGNGGVFEPFVTVEFSNEAAPSSGTPVCPTFQVPGEATVTVAARFMRAVVSNYRGGGAPTVDIGGTIDAASFATIVAPAGNGDGAPVDTSALPALKTIQVAGPFRGTLIVEISEDGGNRWSALTTFTNPGAATFVVIAEFMRVRRGGVPKVSPGLPVINVGAVSAGGGGGGGGGFLTFDVKDFGAKGNGQTDDTAAIQRTLDAAANADGGGVGFQGATVYVPFGIYPVSSALDVPYNVSIVMDPAGEIRATAAMQAILRTDVATPMRENIIQGGILDASGLATDAIWFRNARGVRVENVTVMNVAGTAIHFGDTGAPDTSYGLYTDNVSVWRLAGAIPAGSVGILLETGCGDCLIRTAQIVGCETGIKIKAGSGNNRVIGAHVWSFASTGSTKVGFDDSGNGNTWIAAYADTPSVSGFSLSGQNTVLSGCRVFNNSIYGTDNTLIGVVFTIQNPTKQFATILGMQFKGSDVTHRIAKDIDAWDRSGIQIYGSQFTNVVVTNGSTPISATTIAAADVITANNRIELVGAAGTTNRRVDIKTGNLLRWSVGGDGVAESGGNAGSGYLFNSYNDAGVLIRSEGFVRRSDGQWTFAGPVLCSSGLYAGTGARLQTSGAAAPVSGAHTQGEIVWNTAPVAAGNVGWVCVATGTPGTWKTFGTIAA